MKLSSGTAYVRDDLSGDARSPPPEHHDMHRQRLPSASVGAADRAGSALRYSDKSGMIDPSPAGAGRARVQIERFGASDLKI